MKKVEYVRTIALDCDRVGMIGCRRDVLLITIVFIITSLITFLEGGVRTDVVFVRATASKSNGESSVAAVSSDLNANDFVSAPDTADIGHSRSGGEVEWAVDGASRKHGAGVLFFAYGGLQLNRFLGEAVAAARSFRRHNPQLQIAIVTNNATVDGRVFNQRVAVRSDLLFAGDTSNGGQNRGDKVPRQWLTRLYYLAHSPYDVTWALDSNAVSCTEGAAQAFLNAALSTRLWGFDIIQANQAKGSKMYPHNWNLAYRWSAATRSLLRDWLLLQLRRGVTHDDQKTLHQAELRHVAARKLRVGQIAAPFATAFLNAQDGPDKPRLTRRIVGRSHIVHHSNHSLCAVVNERPAAEAEDELPRQLVSQKRLLPTGRFSSELEYTAVHNETECTHALTRWKKYLPRSWAHRRCALSQVEPSAPHSAKVLGVTPAFAVKLDSLEQYVKSKDCGEECHSLVDSIVRL